MTNINAFFSTEPTFNKSDHPFKCAFLCYTNVYEVSNHSTNVYEVSNHDCVISIVVITINTMLYTCMIQHANNCFHPNFIGHN